ncbi:MAG: hypothetical protein KJ737_23225 [Proteobacteria bacterium]|nr:hypothetical protein [Pseudomonadota bacterium]
MKIPKNNFFSIITILLIVFQSFIFNKSSLANTSIKNGTPKPDDPNQPFMPEGEVGNTYSLKALLSDNITEENTIYFRGNYREGDGITHQFMEQLTYNILKNITSVDDIDPSNPYRGRECLLSEIYQYAMFEGEIRENNYIKRRLATGAVIDSAMILFEKTDAYKHLKKFEQTLSKYFIIEFRRDIASEKAMFYLPGKRPSSKAKDKTLYNVSLSTLFYSSTDSFKGYYSLELNCHYLGTQTSTLYDFGKNELKFRVKNKSLDMYLSSNIDFTAIHDNDGVDTFLLRMLFNY